VDNDRGLAGLLYTIEFVERYFGMELIDRQVIVEIGMKIFNYGIQNKLPNGTLVFPEPYPDDRITIGLGRGSGGIMIRLLRIPEILSNTTIAMYLRQSVDYILLRQLENGHVVDN
jgi:hypothetical protein